MLLHRYEKLKNPEAHEPKMSHKLLNNYQSTVPLTKSKIINKKQIKANIGYVPQTTNMSVFIYLGQHDFYIFIDSSMKTIVLSALISLLITQSFATYGVDVVGPLASSAFSCLAGVGNQFAIVRAFHVNASTGLLDTNAVATLTNAQTAGLMTDIYMVICRTGDPAAQVDAVVAAIPANLYATIFIKVIENITSACSWQGHGYSYADNCAFIQVAIAQVQSYGVFAGIFSTSRIWANFFGSSCNNLGSIIPPVNLWYGVYTTSGHLTPVATFSDYPPFGGWVDPSIKQIYGNITQTLCNVAGWTAFVDFNWFP